MVVSIIPIMPMPLHVDTESSEKIPFPLYGLQALSWTAAEEGVDISPTDSRTRANPIITMPVFM